MELILLRLFIKKHYGRISTRIKKDAKKMRMTKRSTRVDLTPMVDLGFLLITFFIFTTTMSEPTAMKLTVPDDTQPALPTKTPEEKTFTIVLTAQDSAWMFAGKNIKTAESFIASPANLRERIIAARQHVVKSFGTTNDFMILIKPTDEANYENIVNVLDEMTVNDVRKYALTSAIDDEVAILTNLINK